MLRRFTRARHPRAACTLEASEAAVVELRRRGHQFVLAAGASVPLEPELFAPSFDKPNIPDRDGLAVRINELVESAGLGRRQRWSVLLPETAVRSLVLSFETIPASRVEMREMIAWKVERMVGVPAADLRIARQFVVGGGAARCLAVAMRRDVHEEYEALFALLGWRAGLLVPRYVGEAAWFDWDPSPGDKLLIGARGPTCLAAIVRGGELLLVRPIDGDPSRLDDEVYRFALFYRDRVAESPERAVVTSVLANGAIDGERVAATVGEALGVEPALMRPVPDLLAVEAESGLEPSILAAAGLAAQAWSRV